MDRLDPFFSAIRWIGTDCFFAHGRFVHPRIHTLPKPSHALQVIVLGQAGLPNGFEDPVFHPFLEIGMNRTGCAEALFGQGFPLDAGSGYKDNGFKDGAFGQGFPATPGIALVLLVGVAVAMGIGDERLNQEPEIVGDLPGVEFALWVHEKENTRLFTDRLLVFFIKFWEKMGQVIRGFPKTIFNPNPFMD